MRSNALRIITMHGLGDSIHERAVVRELMRDGRELWLETPWPSVFHDFAAAGVQLVQPSIQLRTQLKNARRQRREYTKRKDWLFAKVKRLSWTPDGVRAAQSVVGAMVADAGVGGDLDFRLPIPEAWAAQADALIASWPVGDRPILVTRPLVERREWEGNTPRNPEFAAYATLYRAIRERFFVVSVADLADGKEWTVGEPMDVDVALHGGELPFETLAALFERAAMVYCAPGFSVILAQAVGTPVAAVFGGFEKGYSFSAGARFAPYLALEPIVGCDCFKHAHECDKRMDVEAARPRLVAFAESACL